MNHLFQVNFRRSTVCRLLSTCIFFGIKICLGRDQHSRCLPRDNYFKYPNSSDHVVLQTLDHM